MLDAGAFVAFEKGDARVRAQLAAARRLGIELVTTSPVIGQVWRDGKRQVLLGKLVAATKVDAPAGEAARRAGEILAKTRTNDVVDALLAEHARDGDVVLTSDPGDIRRLLAAAGKRAAVTAV